MEWIPYNDLKNIKFLTKGGFSEIYQAIWVNGTYMKWDPKERQLRRFGSHRVILKRLDRVHQSWLEEVCNLS